MRVIFYSDERRSEWDNFIRASKKGTFLFERNFMEYHSDRFCDCSLMIYDCKERLIGVMPANWVEGEKTVYSHQGLTYGGLCTKPDARATDVLEMMTEIRAFYAKELSARRLVYKCVPYIYSNEASDDDLYSLFRLDASLVTRTLSTAVNLECNPKLQTLRKRGVKKAQQAELVVRELDGHADDCKKIACLWTILTDVLNERHNVKPVHSLEEILLLMGRFPKNIKVFVVENKVGNVLAGTVVFESETVAHTQYISASSEGKANGALDLLFYTLISKRYKDKRWLDFGVSTEQGGRVLNEGLQFQKEGFGARGIVYDTYSIALDDVPNDCNNVIKYQELKRQNQPYKEVIKASIESVIDSGWYIHGEWNKRFNEEWSKYCGRKYCTGVGNGLDAIEITLRAMKEMAVGDGRDEVIVPANTFVATILAIRQAGLKPRLVDPDEHSYLLTAEGAEKAVNEHTFAIMAVHLYGRVCDMKALRSIANKHNIFLLDDCAQCHGARMECLSDASCWSFYPGKNLGAMGDGGAVTTDNKLINEIVAQIANYGQSEKYVNRYIGRNSRLDEIQAAVLCAKLPHLDKETTRRKEIASLYIDGLKDLSFIQLPELHTDNKDCVWHIFPILTDKRNQLQEFLKDNGIETLIHYPIPPHLQDSFKNEEFYKQSLPITERIHREELSLPISPYMTDDEVKRIISTIHSFKY